MSENRLRVLLVSGGATVVDITAFLVLAAGTA